MMYNADVADARVTPAEPVLDQVLITGHSLEITAKDVDHLADASPLITPDTSISIAFIPGESLEARVNAAVAIRKFGFRPVPHISARRITSTKELDAFLTRLVQEAGIDEVFVVAGDSDRPAGPYEDSLAILRSGVLAEYGIRKVGIAGYPEGHTQIAGDKLTRALDEKHSLLTDGGYDYDITTQFAFDAQPVIEWVERIRDKGINAPLRIGVPGPASVKTLLRFASRCGVAASTRVMAKYGLSIGKLLTTTGPDVFVTELANNLKPRIHGAVSLHFYPFGGLRGTAEWIRQFSKKNL